MTLLFILGVVLVLVSIALAGMAIAKPQPHCIGRSLAVLDAMSSAPSELTQELNRPFSERLTGGDSAERIRHKLDLAGNPRGLTVDRIISAKVMFAVVGLVVSLGATALLGTSTSLRVVIVAGATALDDLAPTLYVYQPT